MNTADHSTLTFPARDSYTVPALDYCERLMQGLRFDQTEQRHIRLALEEILAFMQRAVLSTPEPAPITVSFESQAHGILIRITTKGLPINIDQMPAYSPRQMSEELEPDGLSLYLARQVLDNIEFVNRGRDGLEAVLFKHRAEAHVEKQTDGRAEATAKSVDWLNYEIHKAEASDSLEISRCAYLTYGYTYEDYIYYPEEITRLNHTGELHSLLAVNDQSVVMGHCGLKFDRERRDQAELGVLFVRPECRKKGLGAALWAAATVRARELGLQGIFARSVTGHRASQIIAQENGFRDCALSLALFPRAVHLENLGGKQPGKMSCMLQWLGLVPYQPDSFFVPERYADVVLELYHRVGLQVAPGCISEASSSQGEPLLRVKRLPILNVAMLFVESIGSDFLSVVRWLDQAHRRLCREKIEMIYLYIHMQQVEAIEVTDFAASKGYVFSGIWPKAFPQGDALSLQYINLMDNPFEKLVVWTETAEFLRDFIKKEVDAMETF